MLAAAYTLVYNIHENSFETPTRLHYKTQQSYVKIFFDDKYQEPSDTFNFKYINFI